MQLSVETAAAPPRAAQTLDVDRVRADFPALVTGNPTPVYLDSASTTQKPRVVTDAMTAHYEREHANVHRGVYRRAAQATAAYEGARDRVAGFVNAWDRRGVVFTRNFTEAANLVAYAWARRNLGPGDEILTTELEHHSNLLPWRQAARDTGARVRTLPVTGGTLDLTALEQAVTPRTRLVAVTAMSNVTGARVDLRDIERIAHAQGALLFVDGAQLTPHAPVDVQQMNADFFGFSGHKLLGPTSIGALVAKPALLEAMEPFLTGGGMILDVTEDDQRWNELPWKFEAGTPMIAEAVGLHAALDYLDEIGMDRVRAHEHKLGDYAFGRLSRVDGVTIYGAHGRDRRGATFAFNVFDDRGALIHPHDVGTFLDQAGVEIRVGHHCAKPLMRALGVVATCRASGYIYNDPGDFDRLIEAIVTARDFFCRV
jgi:cysteine desulfurase/selenocysteine lyase